MLDLPYRTKFEPQSSMPQTTRRRKSRGWSKTCSWDTSHALWCSLSLAARKLVMFLIQNSVLITNFSFIKNIIYSIL